MVVDTSALCAVLFAEDGAGTILDALVADPRVFVSAATLVEAGIVVEARLGPTAGRELDLLLHRLRAQVVAVEEDQAELARRAWRRFGKSRHPAALNYGDCFSYALATALGEPLLCVGTDFPQTHASLVLEPEEPRRP